MSRKVRCGLIQASNVLETDRPLSAIKKAMTDKHLRLIEQAARRGERESHMRRIRAGIKLRQ